MRIAHDNGKSDGMNTDNDWDSVYCNGNGNGYNHHNGGGNKQSQLHCMAMTHVSDCR